MRIGTERGMRPAQPPLAAFFSFRGAGAGRDLKEPEFRYNQKKDAPLNLIPIGVPAGGTKAKDKFAPRQFHQDRW